MDWKKGRPIWGIVLILNPVASIILGVWAFSLPGTVGLVRWDSEYRFLIGLVLSAGLWAPVLWLAGRFLFQKGRMPGKVFKGTARIISVLILIATVGAMSFLMAQPMLKKGDKPPLLMVGSHSGPSVPDLILASWTERPETRSVAWGIENDKSAMIESVSQQIHRFRFSDLHPGQSYGYQTEGGPAVAFRSLPDISDQGSKPLRIAFSADVHFGSSKRDTERTDLILSQLLGMKEELDLFCIAGDITEMGFFDSEWGEAIDCLSPAFSQIPFLSVPGNHDAIFGGYRHYLDYMHPYRNAEFEDLYRRVSIGPVHFLLLSVLSGMEDVSSHQLHWLEMQLASIPLDHWVVVVSHCFYYSSGMLFTGEPWYDHPDTIRTLTPLFEQYEVDLVISGHNHHMEVLEHNGVTYAVVGTMGAPLDRIDYHSPASVWLHEDHGWLDVQWTIEEAVLRFFRWDGHLLNTHRVARR